MSTTFFNLADAITTEENSQWPNNPGALTNTDGTRATFADWGDGFDALVSKLGYDASGQSTAYSPNETLSQYMNTYTNGDPNAANTVASVLGVSPNTTLSNLSDQSSAVTGGPMTQEEFNNMIDAGNYTSTFGGKESPVTGKKESTTNLSNVAPRLAAVVVGFILIAGAVFSFSQVKQTIISTAQLAA
jgi:hypothetical protein